MQDEKTAVVWFTNNLRIRDNRILSEACTNHDKVIGVYCFDKDLYTTTQFGFNRIERFRAKFLVETVTNLEENLRALNISLVIGHEASGEFIANVCNHYKANTLYYQQEFTTVEQELMYDVKTRLNGGIHVESWFDQFLVHPLDVPFNLDDIPFVFSKFRRKIEKFQKIHLETRVPKMRPENLLNIKTEVPTLEALGFENFEQPIDSAFPFKGGETEALNRLNYYFFESRKLDFYLNTRNGLKGTDYSSKFSAWLANGSISARTIYWKVKEYENLFGSNKSTYWLVFELLWRDYFKYVAMRHGNSMFKLNGIKHVNYEWSTDTELVSSWINGTTSEPFVNANMIELQQTGWMSNRGRQNVASYFAKELQLDWRIGAAYFESMLIDYDVHSNYGNWQYVSGVGNDPRDRKFNVKFQADRYDSRGSYQRVWLQPTLF